MQTGNPSLLYPLLVTATLLPFAPPPLAEEVVVTKPYILDSTTDRIPAKTTFPRYPRIARRDRIEGDATVCFRIDLEGRIRGARLRTATHPIFKRAALRAIRASSFEPLAPNQVLATGLTCRTYRFRLNALPANTARQKKGVTQ